MVDERCASVQVGRVYVGRQPSGVGKLKGKGGLRRARHDHPHWLSLAPVHLDVHDVRRHPHEVARMGFCGCSSASPLKKRA